MVAIVRQLASTTAPMGCDLSPRPTTLFLLFTQAAKLMVEGGFSCLEHDRREVKAQLPQVLRFNR